MFVENYLFINFFSENGSIHKKGCFDDVDDEVFRFLTSYPSRSSDYPNRTSTRSYWLASGH